MRFLCQCILFGVGGFKWSWRFKRSLIGGGPQGGDAPHHWGVRFHGWAVPAAETPGGRRGILTWIRSAGLPIERALREIDGGTALAASVRSIEFIGKNLLGLATWASANKRFQISEFFKSRTMLRGGRNLRHILLLPLKSLSAYKYFVWRGCAMRIFLTIMPRTVSSLMINIQERQWGIHPILWDARQPLLTLFRVMPTLVS